MGDRASRRKDGAARRGTTAPQPETEASDARPPASAEPPAAADSPGAGWRSTGEQGRSRSGGGGGGDVVHNRIAVLRAERSITRRQLAEALGVHYQTVGYLERGEYSPSLYLALRIAEYFEVPIEVIFSITPFPRIGSSPPASA